MVTVFDHHVDIMPCRRPRVNNLIVTNCNGSRPARAADHPGHPSVTMPSTHDRPVGPCAPPSIRDRLVTHAPDPSRADYAIIA